MREQAVFPIDSLSVARLPNTQFCGKNIVAFLMTKFATIMIAIEESGRFVVAYKVS